MPREAVLKLVNEAKITGLEINQEKTKYVRISRKIELVARNYKVRNLYVEKFKYLGSELPMKIKTVMS